MYLSRYLKVDEKVTFKKIQLFKVKHNQKLNNYYLLCTTPSGQNLFEIINGEELSKKYTDCYLLGISKDKEWLIQILMDLVDQLYNKKSIDYPMLKVQ